MDAPIIRVKDIHKSYGRGPNRFDALKGVTFDIQEGESKSSQRPVLVASS
ncbi:MAG: hypothetical protein ACOH1M_01205 [Rhodoglobus sp.]